MRKGLMKRLSDCAQSGMGGTILIVIDFIIIAGFAAQPRSWDGHNGVLTALAVVLTGIMGIHQMFYFSQLRSMPEYFISAFVIIPAMVFLFIRLGVGAVSLSTVAVGAVVAPVLYNALWIKSKQESKTDPAK